MKSLFFRTRWNVAGTVVYRTEREVVAWRLVSSRLDDRTTSSLKVEGWQAIGILLKCYPGDRVVIAKLVLMAGLLLNEENVSSRLYILHD